MNLKATTKIETNKYELEIEVSAPDFEAAVSAAYKTESKKMAVPGFRKGKAPRPIVEKMYGESVFFEAAVDALYRPTVMEAIAASELKVVSVGEMEVVSVSKETGLNFKLDVVVKPEVTIDGYKGIAVEKESATVTDADIAAEIKKVQERNARIVAVDNRAAMTGDTAVLDFEGFVDGEGFEGGKAEMYELALGAGQFIPGFEDQIVGHEIGESFDVNVKFPADYQAENLQDKEAVFKITLHELKSKELPEVDDEFVKDVSEFDTLEAYKADLTQKLTQSKQKTADAAVDNQLIDTLVEKIEAEIPNEMIENEINESLNNFAYRLQSQGLNIDTYMQYTGLTPETIREQFRVQSEKNVKVRLALEKIVELEKIEATEAELDAEYEKLATAYNMPMENVKTAVNPDDLKADVTNQKAVALVKETAVITEKA